MWNILQTNIGNETGECEHTYIHTYMDGSGWTWKHKDLIRLCIPKISPITGGHLAPRPIFNTTMRLGVCKYITYEAKGKTMNGCNTTLIDLWCPYTGQVVALCMAAGAAYILDIVLHLKPLL